MKLSNNEKYAMGGAVVGIVGYLLYSKMSGGSTGAEANLLGARDFMHLPGNFAGPLDNPDKSLAGARDWMNMPGQIVQKMTAAGKGLMEHDVLGQHWSLLGE